MHIYLGCLFKCLCIYDLPSKHRKIMKCLIELCLLLWFARSHSRKCLEAKYTYRYLLYIYILFYTYFWFHVSFKSFNSVTTRTVGKGLPLPITWSLTRSLMRSPVSRAWNRAVPWSSQIVDSWTSIWKHTMDQRRNTSKSWAPSDAGVGLLWWLEQDKYTSSLWIKHDLVFQKTYACIFLCC